MVSFSTQRLLGAEFRSMTGPERSAMQTEESELRSVKDLSFKYPSMKLINHSASRMDQVSISRIHAAVETASGNKAEIILKLNLPSQPHISISANAENHAALEECTIALKTIWPKADADSPSDRKGLRNSIIFDLPARYLTETDLIILNMQFVKMITENIPAFKTATISELCFSAVTEKQAENLRHMNNNP